MRLIAVATLLPALLALAPSVSSATWEAGHTYVGPSIGLSFLGSAPQLGLNLEVATELEGIGTVGFGGVFRYWSYTEDYHGWWFADYYGKWKYTNVLFGAQANYHHPIPDMEELDPFAGLVLAYNVGSVSWDGPRGHQFGEPSSGGLWVGATAGARYWLTPTVALVGRLGFGSLSYGALEVGVDFKL